MSSIMGRVISGLVFVSVPVFSFWLIAAIALSVVCLFGGVFGTEPVGRSVFIVGFGDWFE